MVLDEMGQDFERLRTKGNVFLPAAQEAPVQVQRPIAETKAPAERIRLCVGRVHASRLRIAGESQPPQHIIICR